MNTTEILSKSHIATREMVLLFFLSHVWHRIKCKVAILRYLVLKRMSSFLGEFKEPHI